MSARSGIIGVDLVQVGADFLLFVGQLLLLILDLCHHLGRGLGEKVLILKLFRHR
jgi:hypothetical protein